MRRKTPTANPDPYAPSGSLELGVYRDTTAKTLSNFVANPAQRTLILIVAGQSLATDMTPSAFSPANPTRLLNFNTMDGGIYAAADPLVGTNFANAAPFGPGCFPLRIADRFVSNAIFDWVVLAPISIGATAVAVWETGELTNRIPNAVTRLASRGLTPTTTGVTFGVLWSQGESDGATSQAAYAASLTNVIAKARSAGLPTSVRWFICKETWNTGVVSAAVQAAQVGILDNVNVFSGGDMDSLNATNRLADNTHLNDTGATAAALLVYNAMHASGAPF